MFWPYRPRAGYPSVPRWLLVVLLIVASLGLLFALSVVGGPTVEGGPVG